MVNNGFCVYYSDAALYNFPFFSLSLTYSRRRSGRTNGCVCVYIERGIVHDKLREGHTEKGATLSTREERERVETESFSHFSLGRVVHSLFLLFPLYTETRKLRARHTLPQPDISLQRERKKEECRSALQNLNNI